MLNSRSHIHKISDRIKRIIVRTILDSTNIQQAAQFAAFSCNSACKINVRGRTIIINNAPKLIAIQSVLMCIGLILADIPLAAVWIILILIMAISQIPVLLFNIPMIIYLFAFLDPLPATLRSIYFMVMVFIDNLLKPLFMGKGSDVPMLVIFLGALGGFIAFGFIGLFLGSIVLSLAYKLYVTWISNEN